MTDRMNALMVSARIFYIGSDARETRLKAWGLFQKYVEKFGPICCVEFKKNEKLHIVVWAYKTGIVFEGEFDNSSIRFFSIEEISK